MVLKLYRGETVLRTLYNVTKISSEVHGVLIVTNKIDHDLHTREYSFNKHFHRFIVELD